jgi:Holliday junction resolvasome RuvABC endonuclease subunit
MTQNIILSVSPGRHRIGYAIFHDGKLLYYGGTSLGRYKTNESAENAVEKFLKRIFTRYQVNHLAIPKLIKQQELSILLVSITALIKAVARTASVSIHEYSPIYIREQFCKNEKSTKANTAKNLAARYGELNKYFNRTSEWERKYYGFVFTAVAAGAICAEELKNKENNRNV